MRNRQQNRRQNRQQNRSDSARDAFTSGPRSDWNRVMARVDLRTRATISLSILARGSMRS